MVDLLNDLLTISGKIPVYDLSTINRFESTNGYTIINFCFCYVIGAAIKRIEIKRINTLLLSIPVVITYVWCMLEQHAYGGWHLGTALSYNSPFVLLTAGLILLRFADMPNKSNYIVNNMAGATFTFYLLHVLFIGRISNLLVELEDNLLLFIIVWMLSFCVIFVISYIIYNLYNRIYELILINHLNRDINYYL